MVKVLTMEHLKLTMVMHSDKLRGIPDNPLIANWRSATNNSASYGIFSPFGFPNLASPDHVYSDMTGNSDRIRCPLDTRPRDQVISGLIPQGDHNLYEHRHLQPYKVPAYRGRGRELK